jgi:hypothetical protein
MNSKLLLGVFFTLAVPSLADADVGISSRFALHRKVPTTKVSTVCTTYSPLAENIPCWYYSTSGPVGQYSLVYMVVVQGPLVGINGASFGIDYNGRAGEQQGIDPQWNTWYPCMDGLGFYSDGGFGEFPAPQGGARVTWITCQTHQTPNDWGTQALIGALSVYAYSEDNLKLTPNNNVEPGPELTVALCNGTQCDLLELYPPGAWDGLTSDVHFGGNGSYGWNVCWFDAVAPTTWGKVKALYSPTKRKR